VTREVDVAPQRPRTVAPTWLRSALNERSRGMGGQGGGTGERTASGRLDGGTVPVVDAATVVLVRDADGTRSAATEPTGSDAADDRLEVLLLERHLRSDFAGGALVFPGGKVDAMDRELAPDRWRIDDLGRWVELLGAGDRATALGLLVAAVRETFEEAGILLALRSDGAAVTQEDLATPDAREARAKLAERGGHWDWRPWLVERGLVLDLPRLGMWSWWVTPSGQHRRFDTRFLLATVPPGQHARHDAIETTSLRWTRPREALAAQARGDATVIYPTRCNLRALATYPDVASVQRAVLEDAVDRRRIEPSIVHVEGRPMVQHPDGGAPEPI
jgi:8-oxo-dGTP pyrophosphatase MutT (NUDIX family)